MSSIPTSMLGSLEEGAVDKEVVANLLAWPHTCFGAHVSREIPKNEGPLIPGCEVRCGGQPGSDGSLLNHPGP
jgi:hypothetical protein